MVLPPSSTESGVYKVLERRPMVEASPELIEWAKVRRRSAPRPASPRGGTATKTRNEGKVPEGQRFYFLRSECGKLHDGTRDLAQLTEDLLAIRDAKCENPDTFEYREICNVAVMVHRMHPCKPKKTKELAELVETLSERWYERERKRLSGKNEVRFMRLLIRKGGCIGAATVEGLRVRMSFLQAARELGCHVNTITNIRDRLVAKGELRYDQSERQSSRDPGTFVLLDPRRLCDSPNNSSSLGERNCSIITSTSRKGVYDLETAHHRHRGPVGYSQEDTLCHVEAYGPKTVEELARLLGWSRPRDLRHRHLDPLVELGLLEYRDGLYAVPGDYRARMVEVRREYYSTLQARVVRVRSQEGMWVHVVQESGMVASEEERDRLDVIAADRKRRAFHEHLAKDTPEADEQCRDLLNAWDEEREAPLSGFEVDGTISELQLVNDPEPIRSEVEVFEVMRGFFKASA